MSVKDKNVMDVNKYGMVIQLFLHEKSLLLFIKYHEDVLDFINILRSRRGGKSAKIVKDF